VDINNEQIIFRDYVNIGVAVDTDHGLLVPVIKNADKNGINQISRDLSKAAERARKKSVHADEMKGATFTITNLGSFGTSYFTPIVTWPQSGVLGTGKAKMEPIWNGEAFAPKLILPLSISYDHRIVDGAYAAKFLRQIAQSLEEPMNLLL